ncbi:hypothetical protein Nham_4236 (plasmid) [Nitrobacter hamburgensis X14]|uniref:Uncharacterized protein n=1 Tax=Nitrobacter hamburgensis (strain DSM 10229 / NCIMB 13809 / X14) TaxID=323097 RepID=Q1QFZ6_NITHX|nr:hypothetical protein Nham_4236 [Nitrobacter hamburgensis X14]
MAGWPSDLAPSFVPARLLERGGLSRALPSHREFDFAPGSSSHLSLRVRVAGSFGRSDQYSVLRHLHVIEGVARDRPSQFRRRQAAISQRGTLMLTRSSQATFASLGATVRDRNSQATPALTRAIGRSDIRHHH